MDHRIPLKRDTVLDFEGLSCHIEEVVGQGSNAIVYKGWYPDSFHQNLYHHVLVKELFPFHPQKKIRRGEDGRIQVEPEAQTLWLTHKESFEIGNEVHLRLLYDHPEMMVMGANLNSFHYNGTLYSVLGYTGGRSFQTELSKNSADLRQTVQRMINLLDALEAFHKSGYLHLDISPDNIMLVGQGEQERMFLIDYNSARKQNSSDNRYLSCKTGFSAPEVSTGNQSAIGYCSDLYSVAAVFYRCLMGRNLTLNELLQFKAPDGRDSLLLKEVPQTVCHMVGVILRKGLQTLTRRRYQSIGQMREAFLELRDRIDCVGITHWSLWENGKKSVEELIRTNPSLRYLTEKNSLYPIRLERENRMSLEQYLDDLLSSDGKSGLLLAQGGTGKTTLLLQTALLQGKRYSPTEPAVFYISLNPWDKADTHFIRSQILMRLRFKKEENTFDSAMHALQQLLGQTIRTKQGEKPMVLLLLDGLNEVRGDIGPLVQEIRELNTMAGVRILAASRSEIPELELETMNLVPLEQEDLEDALGKAGLLLPSGQEILRLLRTPLILSLYIQASEGDKQPDIRSEEELLDVYLAALRDKELRTLPEDSPRRWQIDAALNYLLPAIAAEAKRRNGVLTREQMLAVTELCWKTVNTRRFRTAYDRWIGHSGDIRAGAKTPDEWFGIMLDGLLWQRLGMLTKDDFGGYRIYHQVLEDHLATYRLPIGKRKGWIGVFAVVLLCAVIAVGYCRYEQEQKQEAEETIRESLQLGAAGYVEFGGMYQQLQRLTQYALDGDGSAFQLYYDRTLGTLLAEKERTETEVRDVARAAKSSDHDQMRLSWGNKRAVFEYAVLSDLLLYPDERAAFYSQQLPLLKAWTESGILREKTPEFADCLWTLLEADAQMAAELYHIAVAVHLPAADGQEIWVENIHDSVALVDALDAHRVMEVAEDRGQRLSTLKKQYEDAMGEFERCRAKLERYITTMERQ